MSKTATKSSDPRGLKRVCACGARFYDMNKRPVICPNCETEFTGEIKIKTRRSRAATKEKEAPGQVPEKKAKEVANDDADDNDDDLEDDNIVSLDDVDEVDEDEDDDDIALDDDDLGDLDALDDLDDEDDDDDADLNVDLDEDDKI